MRESYRLILYAIAGLIILAGGLLFGFQANLLGYVQTQSGLTFTLSPVAPAASSSALDTSLLQSPNFTALVNHVINFDFDNICWRPDTFSQTVSPANVVEVTATGTAATDTAAVGSLAACHQGNSLPFVVKTTIK